MTDYNKYFKEKKITIMGLGLLGRGIGYTKFLAECGAILTVTDLKSKKELAPALKALKKYQNIKYVLGEHRLSDFKNKDMVIKAAGVPLDSIYIKEAKKNKIPVEMDVSLFLKYAPDITCVGVTGTRGKSMTTMLIYEILKDHEKKLKCKIYLGGNIRGIATLPLLSKVKKGDILVCELDSWQLQGFGEAKISPDIAVFTSFMPDHMNYYKDDMKKYFNDKANIFKYQKKDDLLVIRPDMKEWIKKSKAKMIIADKSKVKGWKFAVPGEHQQENLACAVEVCLTMGLSLDAIKKSVSKFEGMEGRLKYLKTYKGIKIYNDNNATTPEATIAGLKALGNSEKNIVLIAGGADKNLDLASLVKSIQKYCKAIVLLEGTGTTKLITNYKLLITNEITASLEDAVDKALLFAEKGDILLFSPAFASFGMFANEYDRNDQFLEIIKGLK